MQDEHQPRMVASFHTALLQNQQRPVISPNQVEVWIVENQHSAAFPLTSYPRRQILQALIRKDTDEAIWGGKMDVSLASLADAEKELSDGKPWKILPPNLGNPDQLALCRSVVAVGSDSIHFLAFLFSSNLIVLENRPRSRWKYYSS